MMLKNDLHSFSRHFCLNWLMNKENHNQFIITMQNRRERENSHSKVPLFLVNTDKHSRSIFAYKKVVRWCFTFTNKRQKNLCFALIVMAADTSAKSTADSLRQTGRVCGVKGHTVTLLNICYCRLELIDSNN